MKKIPTPHLYDQMRAEGTTVEDEGSTERSTVARTMENLLHQSNVAISRGLEDVQKQNGCPRQEEGASVFNPKLYSTC